MEKEPLNAAGHLRQQQEQLHGQILRRFAHYGQPTCQAIRQALGRKNGMLLLLQRLGLLPPSTLEFQVQALAAYLKEHGAVNFLRLIRTGTDAGAAAPAAPAPVEKADPPPRGARANESATPRKTRDEPPPAASDEAASAARIDERGRSIGAERRSGVERRSGIDRRDEVAAIRSNKRYGGDRRKKIRRQCDRVLACRLGLGARKFPPPPGKKIS